MITDFRQKRLVWFFTMLTNIWKSLSKLPISSISNNLILDKRLIYYARNLFNLPHAKCHHIATDFKRSGYDLFFKLSFLHSTTFVWICNIFVKTAHQSHTLTIKIKIQFSEAKSSCLTVLIRNLRIILFI